MKVRWGLIGCGEITEKTVVPVMKKLRNTELLAVMGRDKERTEKFASKHQIPRYCTTVEDILADAELQAIYVATPHAAHHDIVIKAAKAGKHVLCEKPLGVTGRECSEMIQACKENGVRLGVSYYRRFFPQVQKMKEMIESGSLGRITLFRVDVCGGRLDASPKDAHYWMTLSKMGGGVLLDLGSHRIDLVLYLGGPIQQVAALLTNSVMRWETDDQASLLCQLESGAQAVVTCRYNSEVSSDHFEIHGTEATLVADSLGAGLLRIDRGPSKGQEVVQVTPPSSADRDLLLIDSFSKSLIDHSDFLIPGEEGLKTNLVMDAAFRSAREHRICDVT